ncbi:hypothetical protein A7A78_14330 [Aequorivita soesokkakensis]|uniref:HTH araC/xylS-type domain-containing protein n=1 Tax=Aequorivita soesokkakensis TaxID=1385699 RepID=A0A1A9LBU5_9FLAO|nr:helix-turn-helix transcriptional regulator [Aequorivita soesokkakensis]OAD90740.1 hypothetical protein A7A78_14330 [Aequorivita soesokkakensis]
MSFYLKYLLLATVLFTTYPAISQRVPPQELDSLERVITRMNKNNTATILEIGQYIVAHSTSETQKANVYGIIASSYAAKNDKHKSIDYLFKAKDIAETIDDPVLMIKCYGTISSLYASLKLNEKAKPYLLKARNQIDRLPEGSQKHVLNAFWYNGSGNIYLNTLAYNKANESYKSAAGEFEKIHNRDNNIKNSSHYRTFLYNIGNSYLLLKKPDSSQIFLVKALAVKDTSNPNIKYDIKKALAEVYSYKEQYQTAIDTLMSILQDPNFDIEEIKTDIYLNLSKNYKAIGNDAQYAFYNEKYLTLSPAVKNSDLKTINTVFDAEQKGLLSSISKSKSKNKWLLIAILCIVGVSFLSLVFLFYRRRKDQTLYKTIIEKLEASIEAKQTIDTNIKIGEESQQSIPISVEEEILEKLKKFENSQRFTNQKLSISTLAVQLKTNTTYLSEIINRHKGKNFNTYINELRITYICELILQNPEYLNYKISYLAEASGFKSHSVFATVFKNITGISPSSFLREAKKRPSSKV